MNFADVPRRCFQGVLPSIITTVDAEGMPNATYLSQIHWVDPSHVALSCQFFNKTKQNVVANQNACVQFYDPLTLDGYTMQIRFVREEASGPLFDRMSVRIDAIASHAGLVGIFKLRSSDVYEVIDVEKIAGFLAPDTGEAPELPTNGYPTEIYGLQLVSQRVMRARDLDELLSTLLDALHTAFGFEHTMVLLPDESGTKLFAIASRGYEGGIGAEIAIGEGLIGTVARERCILRVAGVGAELRYGRAIRASVHRTGGGRTLRPEIPLPGLVDAQSQMAIPLAVGDRLVGVIAVESRSAAAFAEWHEAYLEIVANQVALAIDGLVPEDPIEPPTPSAAPRPLPAAPKKKLRFFASDDCVFDGEDYLVRNLPGRIFWKLLRAYVDTGRTDFTNRELRLDASLGLPAIRDNLESRLILLRKRLEERQMGITLTSTGRGTFRLDVAVPIELEEAP